VTATPHPASTGGATGRRRLAPALVAASVLFFLPHSAASQGFGLLSGSGDGPLEIEADDGLEWQQKQRRYVARGNAVARRGGSSIRADTLIAEYRGGSDDATGGGSSIHRLIAEGSVVVASETERAIGQRGVYDVESGYFILTGPYVRLTTPQDTITANQSIEYWERQQIAVATGNALAVRADRKIRADRLESYFREGEDGDLAARRIIGRRNVCLESATDVAHGQYGDYDVDSGFAYMQNSVQIFQDGNILRGDAAEVNLNTKVSRLLSRPGGSGGPGPAFQTDGRGSPAARQGSGGRVVGFIMPSTGDDTPAPAIPPQVRCR